MTTVVVSPAASADDGWARINAFNATSGFTIDSLGLSAGRSSDGREYRAFIRMPGLAVPNGATISSATLGLTADSVASAPLTVRAEAADNPAACASGDDLFARTLTAAGVDFTSPAAIGSFTQDATSVVQEIVNRAGWVSGNAIQMFLVNRVATNTSTADFISYDNGSSYPRLTVDYTAAPTTQDESGGSTATVSVTVAGGGSAAEQAQGGSVATVTATVTGGGQAVENFTLTATVDGENVVLTWNAVAGADYGVERSDDGGTTWQRLALDLDALTYTDTPGAGEHLYRVGPGMVL